MHSVVYEVWRKDGKGRERKIGREDGWDVDYRGEERAREYMQQNADLLNGDRYALVKVIREVVEEA